MKEDYDVLGTLEAYITANLLNLIIPCLSVLSEFNTGGKKKNQKKRDILLFLTCHV